MKLELDVRELPGRMEEILKLASEGCEVIVTDGPYHRAVLKPWVRTEPRVMGLHQGAFVMAPDFDAPLPDSFWLGEP